MYMPVYTLPSLFFFFKEINTFIQQGCIKLKSHSKYIYNVIKGLYTVAYILNEGLSLDFFLFIKESGKSTSSVSTKILSSTTVFNTDNNKKKLAD